MFYRSRVTLLTLLCLTVASKQNEEAFSSKGTVSDSLDNQMHKSRFGAVSSPFFYLCHNPRPGEPTDLGVGDVKVTLVTAGILKFDHGYQPKSVYELVITSNVQMDGFLLTGVHAVTKGFTQSKHLHIPSSFSNTNSAGMICSILNSHISKKPKSSFSLMWMSPPKGTGCVAFLATGSLHNQLLFKDLKVLEVCEKEEEIGRLIVPKSYLTSINEDGLIFKDDFEDFQLNDEIWDELHDGEMSSSSLVQSGRGILLHSNASYLQSKPMDFTQAQQIQYAVGRGKCNDQTSVQLLIGSDGPIRSKELKLRRGFVPTPEKSEKIASTESIKDQTHEYEEGSNEQISGDNSNEYTSGDGETEEVTENGSGYSGDGEELTTSGSGDLITDESKINDDAVLSLENENDFWFENLRGPGSGNKFMEIMQADESSSPSKCTHWEVIDTHIISDSQEVHSQIIPLKFRRKNICVQWKNVGLNSELCSSIDDVAVVTEVSHSGPIVDDFDPIDPSNWFFFPGGKIEETCGSEGNSLSFDGIETESWVSTRHMDFSNESDSVHDSILHKAFTPTEDSDGWEIEGLSNLNCLEDGNAITFSDEQKSRKICSPFFDGRSVGVIKIAGGISHCSSVNAVTLGIIADFKGQKEIFEKLTFKRNMEQNSIVLPSKYQKEGMRLCIEQVEMGHQDFWSLSQITLLPWLPSKPEHYFQSQINLKCGYNEVDVDIEVSSDGGSKWWSLNKRCVPGDCEGKTSAINGLTAHGIDSGWTVVTLPLPYIALTSNSRIRIRQLEPGNSIWHPSWAIDYIYIGVCPKGCNGHGICSLDDKCKCEYGFVGNACQFPERPNPLYIAEPFVGQIETSANILETSGGKSSYQCGVIGSGQAAVFKGGDLRFLTTVDINTTDSHYLQFHFRAGTHSDVGKCPGPDKPNEKVFVHYSCSGGSNWHLLKTLNSKKFKEPTHINIPLPPNARDASCRFQIWQAEHSGSGRDIWAIDDLTVTSQKFNTIELSFNNPDQVNSSLRFHLGNIDNSCNRNGTMVFDRSSSSNGLYRFLETKSIYVGPSYMMQFDLAIGCDGISYSEDLDSTVVLEYSLNHGLTWQLVQRPCTPSTPGCEPHFTRGTVYHISEYNQWKRTTIRLPHRTWSPSTRLRLRQIETSEIGLPWAIDNLYIGHQCSGLCSGHGYCTTRGCRCDDEFHGHMCLPLHKLLTEIDTNFDSTDDMERHRFNAIGGTLVSGSEGCGAIVSLSSLYFGVPGIRHFETDDLNAKDLYVISFYMVIGGNHGLQKMCLSATIDNYNENLSSVSYGSVVLEYSTDGGISWKLIREMIPSEYRTPKQFSVILENTVIEEAVQRSGIIRFRIWQPKHNEADQWALDNFAVKPLVQANTLQADFREGANIVSPWLSTTSFDNKKYCGSEDSAQVMDSKDPVRKAVTNVLVLNEGDVITFQISVGCSNEEIGSPVRLEFSRDGGNSWKLLQDGCLPSSSNCKDPQEPSIYWPGHHGQWHKTLIPVDHRLTHGDVQLRWAQKNVDETSGTEFALKDLYIGPPCRFSCHGHGLCTAAGFCKCETGFSGKYCGQRKTKNNAWLRDDFEGASLPSKFWENDDGALVSAGCNSDHNGNVLFFNGDEHRFITTNELDTTNVKFLVFDLQIGADSSESRCKQGVSPQDDVMLEFSVDNGLTWSLLKHFEPKQTIERLHLFFIALPRKARTKQTKFRWWQTPPHMLEKMSADQAEWQLDNVMVLSNETLPMNLAVNFTSGPGDHWFMINGGKVQSNCGKKKDPALVFTGHTSPRYAETWDFEASEATIVQFGIMPKCDERKSSTNLDVEYSTNNGKSWDLLKEPCHPPNKTCEGYDLPSIYLSDTMTNWTRVTVPVPDHLHGERVRLRFKQHVEKGEALDPSSSWAIDNIFIGNSCPWMCSGHGRCNANTCSCDLGYFGKYCVPERVLPCELLDKFNHGKFNQSLWNDIQGAEVSARCGAVFFDTALVFYKDGRRYATTVDLDMSGGDFLQFSLLMGCHQSSKSIKKRKTSNENHNNDDDWSSILIQYSTTGGITWKQLKNVHFQPMNDAAFISVSFADFPNVRTNATRFRLWQPNHSGSLADIWAIDNLFIGGMPVYPNILFDDFNKDSPTKDAWIDWPAGDMEHLCNVYESHSALRIGSGEGQHGLYTRDLNIDGNSVLQFDIRVGCDNQSVAQHNVTLEYSSDFGITWTTLRAVQPLYKDSPDYKHELQTPSVFYGNAAKKWDRVVIPLHGLSVCSNVRFRWMQGFYNPKQSSLNWAIDNVYIGPACVSHCSGHGYCINGHTCDCDDSYDLGETCQRDVQSDQQILENFDYDSSFPVNFDRWSGAELSSQCDVLSGKSLLFWQQGERMLVTKDLDLSFGSVIQFYLRFKCTEMWYSHNDDSPQLILLQYSTNGGIFWNLISELLEHADSLKALPTTKYFIFSLPNAAKTNSTRIRWWQPSDDGNFKSQWAIDQVYIGSTSKGLPFFYDNGNGLTWLLRPGSTIERTCGFKETGLHFSGNEAVRFAETPDIVTTWKSFLQFKISIGCKEINHCFDIVVEYSINHGKSWHLVREPCMPTDVHCPEFWSSSSMTSDLFANLTRVTLMLPKKARNSLARFRFSQSSPWDSHHSWFVAQTYVGDECEEMCFGRGFCQAGKCNCTSGWTGESCTERVTSLPTFIADDFTEAKTNSKNWKKIVGAKLSGICGSIASGPALHFYGSCSRLLETVDIDLREALFIQFNIRTGCLDPVKNDDASGNNSILVQTSCDSGISWRTVKRMALVYLEPKYIWLELPEYARCIGGRVRWWQPGTGPRPNLFDWALDSIIVGGKVLPPDSITLKTPTDLRFPKWLRGYNNKLDKYCNWNSTTQTLESTPSEPAIAQTTDLQITVNHSIHFRLALGCGALWDNSIEPVVLQYSKDHGRSWNLVRELCLPFNSSTCNDLHDESVFYAPQKWQYYVFPLENIGPAKYMRFRWIQNETADVMGTHKWSLTDIYIGYSCHQNCLGRGSCIDQKCICDLGYAGSYCQKITNPNIVYIKDTFKGPGFLPHWKHVQGALLAPGCAGDLEEPPAATFQGPYTRALMSQPVDTRSGRFVLFTAQAGSHHGKGLCRIPTERLHNVFLQYSTDGGIKWHLLRELDHNLYRKPYEDYILLPRPAMSPATVFRFWQPRLEPPPPAWSIDNVFIGGSEIGASHLIDSFDAEPTVSEWLFAPHSMNENNYCERGDNGSMVWEADQPGQRAITTQELIINEDHVLEFKISVGCKQTSSECNNGPQVYLEFTKDGGATGWDLVLDSCFPETSPDPDCFPYVFHDPSRFSPDAFSSWTRVTIPLPEKTWSSTTQFRWIQRAGKGSHQMERILPWALDDVYVGPSCRKHCKGHGNCIRGECQCDPGYEGASCEAHPTINGPLPTSIIDGFEGGIATNWDTITGGSVGMGCNSLAPYGHGKHLYFSGCGIRQAVTRDLDTRKASKVMFVLRIGSHDGTKSCYVDLSDPKRIEDKGVVFQYSSNNGVLWTTIDIHNPLDFRKARRVAYSLPEGARTKGLKLRWWQPFHNGVGTDQWALDNVEIVLAQREATNKYSARVYHDEDL